jgi:hypothetical protein
MHDDSVAKQSFRHITYLQYVNTREMSPSATVSSMSEEKIAFNPGNIIIEIVCATETSQSAVTTFRGRLFKRRLD